MLLKTQTCWPCFKATPDGGCNPIRAMILPALCRLDENPNPLQLAVLPDPVPGPGEILVRVAACGVCHTELDEIEGRTPPPQLPVILGHQVVGQVAALGPGAASFAASASVWGWRGSTRRAGPASSACRARKTCARSSAPRAAMRTAATLN